jgi:S1-C subfamily serine protease
VTTAVFAATFWAGTAAAQTATDFNSLLRDGGAAPAASSPVAAPPPMAAPAPTTAPEPAPSSKPATAARPLAKSDLREFGTAATIYVLVKTKTGAAIGTGFLIAPRLVMTNAHVVEDARLVVVISSDRKRRAATILSITRPQVSGDRDFAVLEVAEPIEARPVAFSTNYHTLDDIVAFGFPAKVTVADRQTAEMFEGTDQRALPTVVASTGSIQNVIESNLHIEVLTHSAKISQGNSGGPLFDACGRVVGINTFIAERTLTAIVDKKKTTFDIPQGYQWALTSREMLVFLKSRAVPVSVDDRPCQ